MSGTILSPWSHSQTTTTDSGLDSDMETDWSQEKNELSVPKSSAEKKDKEIIETQSCLGGENQTKTVDSPKDVQQQFSDTDIDNVLFRGVDWYSSLKDSSIAT